MSVDNIISDLLEKVQGEEGVFPYMANKGEFVPGKSPVYYSGPYWDNNEIEVSYYNCSYCSEWIETSIC